MKNFAYVSDTSDLEDDLEYLKEHEREYYYELLEYRDFFDKVKDKLEAANCFLVFHASIDVDVSFWYDFYYDEDLAHKVAHVVKYTPPFDPDFKHYEINASTKRGGKNYKYYVTSADFWNQLTLERFLKSVLDYIDVEDRCIDCGERSKKYGEHCIYCSSKLDGAGVGAEYAYLTKRVLQAAQILDPTIQDEDTAIEAVLKHLKGQKDA